MRRFPIDPEDAEAAAVTDEPEVPQRTSRRPADKRYRRPHDDKSERNRPNG